MRLQSIWRTSFVVLALAQPACADDSADDGRVAATMRVDQPANASAADGAGTFAEQHANYRLTMPAIRQWYEAQANIYRAMAGNPDLAGEIELFAEASSVDEMEAHFDGIAEVRDAVRDAGLDMRDYAAILITLFHVRAVDAAIQGGADRAQVLADGEVDPADLELVEQNRAELDRLHRSLEELEGSMQ